MKIIGSRRSSGAFALDLMEATSPGAPGTLLGLVRDRIRRKHFSIRTEEAYCDWIKRFILFHGKRHPSALGAPDVERFLTWLAVDRHVAASTQNQAKCALVFLYREVLDVELPWLDGIETARTPARLPVVMTPEEVARVLARLTGVHALIGSLLYGTGLRIMEALRLRVKDVEFARREIVVRDGKGGKDRVTTSRKAMAPYGSHSRCRASIPTPRANGAGSTSFRPKRDRSIRATASCGGTTWAIRRSSAR